jgi:hypothetical protein
MSQNAPAKLETEASAPPKSAQQIQQDIDEAVARQRKLVEESNVSASKYNKEQVGDLAERSAQQHESIDGITRNIEASKQAGLIDESTALGMTGKVNQLSGGMGYVDEQINRLAIVHLPFGERLAATAEGAAGVLGAVGGGRSGVGRGIAGGATRSMKAASKMRGLSQKFKKKPEPAKPVEQKPVEPQKPTETTTPVDKGANVKAKPKGPKPRCGGRATYAKQEGDFAGHGMERDHIPSFAAMKKAFEKWAKKNGHDLDADPEIRKTLFGQTDQVNRAGDGGKLGRHAQTVALPNEVHEAGDTHGAKNTPLRQSEDAGNLQNAAKRDGDAHKRNIKNDKHKGCADELNKSVDAIGNISNDKYEKFFKKLYDDTISGKNTVNPWKGIL